MSEVNHVVKRRLRVQKHRDYNGFKISLFALQPYPNFSAGAFFTKVWIAFLLPIRVIWTIKLFVNRKQIRLLNSKDTDFRLVPILTSPETRILYSRLTIHKLFEKTLWLFLHRDIRMLLVHIDSINSESTWPLSEKLPVFLSMLLLASG